ncbi:MAG: hypothetical protein M5U16_07195 [Hyphomicrobium sp.]|nr:hypothetical protein [Hyphomicrobium sp.]
MVVVSEGAASGEGAFGSAREPVCSATPAPMIAPAYRSQRTATDSWAVMAIFTIRYNLASIL